MQLSTLFRRLLLTVSVGALVGCGADQLTDPTVASLTEQPAFLSGPSAPAQPGVARCERQPYAVASLLVGTAGGKLKVGKHEFEIPRGALSSSVRITMEAVGDSVRSVRFSPAGLVFKSGYLPKLKLDYNGCRIPKGAKKAVVYVNEALRVLEVLRSADDSLNTDVDARLGHFSRYAVAW